jgi:hypothetical protein
VPHVGDFGERFRKDRESVRLDKQLEAHKQQVIEGSQGELWNSLRTTARDKVKEINGSDSLLQFSDSDVNEFTITYDRDGEQRKAKAAFRPSNHYGWNRDRKRQGHSAKILQNNRKK